jgi:broad specificity phosphatase PhoE
VLIVSHGGVLRALERYCHDVDRAFPNVGGRIFELDGEGGTAGDLAITAGPRLFPLDDGQATYTTTP